MDPVGIIYHYTGPDAFSKILENTTLWATDFRYLNDSTELIYVWEPFVATLQHLADDPTDEYSQAYTAQLRALQLMNAANLMDFDDTTFVVAFTELGDALSQWSRYGANGRGIALGFDTDAISTLRAPVFHHQTGGRLIPVLDQNDEPVTSFGFLRKVGYGEAHRNEVVKGLITSVRQNCGKNGESSHETMVANSIFQTAAWMQRLPLAKHESFRDEREHRITIGEHHGGRTAQQRTALTALGEPAAHYATGPLETLNVKFRPNAATMFAPYVELPFTHEALVKIVTGPAIKHRFAQPALRRMLDRNGFRHTKIEASQLPYQA